MALKTWDDIPFAANDCVKDHNEWNDMVDYIRHSACTVFTIYETCPGTGQAFRFTQAGTFSQMYGGDNSGDDLMITANDSNIYPRVVLFGDSSIKLQTKTDVFFTQQATQMAKMSYAANVTIFEGGSVGGDDFIFKCNSANALPKLELQGAGSILLNTTNAANIYFQENNSSFLKFYENATDDVIEGVTVGNDLYLKPVGVVKFGTYAAKDAEAFDGFITIKDAAGNNRKLMTCA